MTNIYRRVKTESLHPPRIDSQELVLRNQNHFSTLDRLVQKFNVEPTKLASTLLPHMDAPWVLYVENKDALTPYFQNSEVRELLTEKGLLKKSFKNRKRKAAWDLKLENSTRHVTKSDRTITIEGKTYGRGEYWADVLGLSKGSLTQILDSFEGTGIGNKIYEAEVENKGKISRSPRKRYMPAEVMQAVVNSYSAVKHLDSSRPMPADEEPASYKTSIEWRKILGPALSVRSEVTSFSSVYEHRISRMPSFVKEIEGVRIRVYNKQAALEATTAATEHIERKRKEERK